MVNLRTMSLRGARGLTLSRPDDADAAPCLLRVTHDLQTFEPRLQFLPHGVHVAAHLWGMRDDVMEGDQTIRRNERPIHLPIRLRTAIAVIAIDEEHID